MTSRLSSLTVLAFIVAACAEPPVTPQPSLTATNRVASIDGARSYVIVANGNSLPSGFVVSVGNVGGTVVRSMDKIGVAVATSNDPSFAAKASQIKGIASVDENVVLQFEKPSVFGSTQQVNQDAAVGSLAFFRNVQWAPDAVHAPDAWAAGYQGAGARVAVVDGGMDAGDFDLAANVDVAHSASCVSGYNFNQDTPGFHHATHVAGIIAARGIGTIGIAPRATIIGVKVLHDGSGDFGAVICGIYYAATPVAEGGAGANIINMSLGGEFVSSGAGAAHLVNALSRATSYANHRGVTVIAAAGNHAVDLDHTANYVSVPAQSVGVVAVAATAPVGWALGNLNVDLPASYTNYGQSAIDLAGPGGDFAYPGSETCSKPANPSSAGNFVAPCWVFDGVMSPGDEFNNYYWAAGTSMASPAVAGVAALIVGKTPGLSPAQVEARLRASADDLGKPGNDDFYGAGRVNAGRAIQ